MKVAVIGAIAFGVGLAGGTGIGMRGGNAAATDSSKVHADSGAAKPDSSAGEHGDSLTTKAADSTKAPEAAEKAAPTAEAEAPSKTSTPAAEAKFDAKAVADAFGKLTGTEAAPLLARFTDDEVIATMKVLGLTRASALMSKLPEPRGTTLSRRLLLEIGSGAKQ